MTSLAKKISLANSSSQKITTEVLVIGAGASGLFCAATAGKRGRKVMVIDHAKRAGLKILMSGGGRCNFTNYAVDFDNFTGNNKRFCTSALKRYSSWDFISLVEKYNIAYHEKHDGQLFCDDSAKDIVTMLLNECTENSVNIQLSTQVLSIKANSNTIQTNQNTTQDNVNITENQQQTGFTVVIAKNSKLNQKADINDENIQYVQCQSLIIATGGLSIPTKGATNFGYQVAEQFQHTVLPTSAGLVPFTFTGKLGEMFASLAGISLDVIAFNERISFARPMLFTHRGLSGFAMLQLSNYWQAGENIHINLVPTTEIARLLTDSKKNQPKQKIRTVLTSFFSKKLLLSLQEYLWHDYTEVELANIKDDVLVELGNTLNNWQIKPSGTEGYRTAEVTLGGVNTDEVSSKTFESRLQPNLYFIGEVLDVTGWLGGYNFQWAWASAHACGEVV